MADPFHVVRVANRCLDTVRRRVQNELLGHRGRKEDPLYRIRKLLLSGAERLDERGSSRMLLGLRLGDPDDAVLGAWLAKESVRDVYLTDDPAIAAVLLDKAIAGCLADERARFVHADDEDDDGPDQAELTEAEAEYLRCLDDEMELDRESHRQP